MLITGLIVAGWVIVVRALSQHPESVVPAPEAPRAKIWGKRPLYLSGVVMYPVCARCERMTVETIHSALDNGASLVSPRAVCTCDYWN